MNVSCPARLHGMCCVLGLRISRVSTGALRMLASLRLLLPKDWSTAHEAAGSWFWHNVEWILQTTIVKPVRYERALAKLVVIFDDQTKFGLQAAINATFFEQCPPGQDFLEQSGTSSPA